MVCEGLVCSQRRLDFAFSLREVTCVTRVSVYRGAIRVR